MLRRFCLPLFGSVLFQQMYNIADSFVAGKFINNEALASVGNSYEITLIFLAFAFGCNIGCSVVVSRLFGAKKNAEMKTAVTTTLISCGILCGILMLGGMVFGGDLLRLINTPGGKVFEDSKLYLDIYILGLPFVFYYNVATGVFSAMGDSKTPFWFLACSSVSNIAVDILFVAGFSMGISGVAWATFLCQGISCALAVGVVLRRLKKIETEKKAAVFSGKILKDISVVAVPSILQQSFISVGNIMIQGLINGFGTAAMAGYSAAVKLNNMVTASLVTIGNGMSNYTAQNLGAGKADRIRPGFKAGLKFVFTLCLPLILLYCIAGRQLVYIFLESPTGDAVEIGTMFLRIVSPFYFLVATKIITDGTLRGGGRMKQFMVSTFADLALRVAVAAVLCRTALQTTGIWLSWPIGWAIATGMALAFFFRTDWTKSAAPTINAEEKT